MVRAGLEAAVVDIGHFRVSLKELCDGHAVGAVALHPDVEALKAEVQHIGVHGGADIEAIRKRGDFYFGVNGIVTFKKSEVKTNLPVIGPNRLLLETDAPYLAPVPKRGKRNESAFTAHVCNFVAAEMGVSPAEIDEITTRNACELFRLNNNL